MKLAATILILTGFGAVACSGSASDADPIADAVPTKSEAEAAAASEVTEENAEKVLADIRKELEQDN